jgi:hypothetical protein
MSGVLGQRPSRPWPPGDPASTPPSEPATAAADAGARGEASALRDLGTSMDAISFGFAATAILISLFLLMAIFEHLIKPRAFPPDSPDDGGSRRPHADRLHGRLSPGKLRSPHMVRLRPAKLDNQPPSTACCCRLTCIAVHVTCWDWVALATGWSLGVLWLFLMRNSWHVLAVPGGGVAAGGGPVGADAGAAVPDVPGATGAAAAAVLQGRRALLATA